MIGNSFQLRETLRFECKKASFGDIVPTEALLYYSQVSAKVKRHPRHEVDGPLL
ncbi:hypothetical protein GCWU000246_01491 [Jonquetella anthropi E3_33 E1]|nr:hypothetical protein GCWU000246_01491 [Jonquetella anthropi E3_33 E1]